MENTRPIEPPHDDPDYNFDRDMGDKAISLIRMQNAMDTPFQWTKQIASHFGGTRNGLAISWPNGIKARGKTRSQLHHVIDIMPTILEAAALPHPTSVYGIQQAPVEGVGMVYSFDNAKAEPRVC